MDELAFEPQTLLMELLVDERLRFPIFWLLESIPPRLFPSRPEVVSAKAVGVCRK